MNKIQSLPIEIKLNENAIREALTRADQTKIEHEVQLLKTGTFHHPDFGPFNIDVKMLRSMIGNFNDNVRGVDIAIDYSHDSNDIAAGWVSGLVLRENDTELWAVVDWTPKGIKRLAEKEFRYMSADFTLDFQDNETLKTFGPTLLGAGLTNRPFVKNMQPAVTLTEKEGTKDMNLDELKAKIEELSVQNKELSEKVASFEKSDFESQIKELTEQLDTEKKRVKTLISEKELAEKESAFDSLVDEGKAVPAQKESYIEGDTVKFAMLAKDQNKKASGSAKGGEPEGDAADKVMKMAEKMIKDDSGLTLSNAVSSVLSRNPKLAKEYNLSV